MSTLKKIALAVVALFCFFTFQNSSGSESKLDPEKHATKNVNKTTTRNRASARKRSVSARDTAIGKELYSQYQCAACHIIAGSGCKTGVPLDGVGSRRNTAFLTEHLRDPEKHVRQNKAAFNGEANLMPQPQLEKQQIKYLIMYLKTLR